MINYPGYWYKTFWYKLIQSRCKLQFHILGLKNNENSHKCFFLVQAQTILEVNKIFGAIHCLSLYQNNLYRNDFGWSGIMMTSLSRVLKFIGYFGVPWSAWSQITDPDLYAWGRGADWVSFCWVCATGLSQHLPHYSLYYGPNLSHFWANVILAIPTYSLSVYASTLKSLLTRSSWNKLTHFLNLM